MVRMTGFAYSVHIIQHIAIKLDKIGFFETYQYTQHEQLWGYFRDIRTK